MFRPGKKFRCQPTASTSRRDSGLALMRGEEPPKRCMWIRLQPNLNMNQRNQSNDIGVEFTAFNPGFFELMLTSRYYKSKIPGLKAQVNIVLAFRDAITFNVHM